MRNGSDIYFASHWITLDSDKSRLDPFRRFVGLVFLLMVYDFPIHLEFIAAIPHNFSQRKQFVASTCVEWRRENNCTFTSEDQNALSVEFISRIAAWSKDKFDLPSVSFCLSHSLYCIILSCCSLSFLRHWWRERNIACIRLNSILGIFCDLDEALLNISATHIFVWMVPSLYCIPMSTEWFLLHSLWCSVEGITSNDLNWIKIPMHVHSFPTVKGVKRLWSKGHCKQLPSLCIMYLSDLLVHVVNVPFCKTVASRPFFWGACLYLQLIIIKLSWFSLCCDFLLNFLVVSIRPALLHIFLRQLSDTLSPLRWAEACWN